MKLDNALEMEVTEFNLTVDLPTWFLLDWPGCDIPSGGRLRGPLGWATYYLWAIAPPMLVMFGTVGNVLTVLIIALTFRRIRSVDAMLITLAVSDTAILWSMAFRNWLLNVWGIDIRELNDFVCKLSFFIAYCSVQYSSLVLVILTGQRVVVTLRPYSVYARDDRKRVLVVASCAFLFLVALNAHLWFGFSISTSQAPSYGVAPSKCGVNDRNYFVFREEYYHWIHFVVAYSLPCVLIISGNVLIIKGLWKNRFENEWSLCNNEPSTSSTLSRHLSERRENQRRSTTIMLVSLNVVFFVTQTPAAIMLVIRDYFIAEANTSACSDFELYKHKAELINLVQSIMHILVYFNSAVNFLLYVQSGTKFRTHAHALLTCNRMTSHANTENLHLTDGTYGVKSRMYVLGYLPNRSAKCV